jgi:undecaprenyl phosphate N,N'-diacetylbacillosamine 1-phosphate transferase
MDLTTAALGLALTSPLLAIAALAVRLSSTGPILFRQERVGRDFRPFTIYKFRTMVADAGQRGGLLTAGADPRITRVGRWLRATKIDELPQLINVLKGDMSIVGPRPTLPYQVELYNDFQRIRLLVKPGITGWAQVNGRNAISWEQRIKFDVWYVENWSLWLDVKILLKTVTVVIRKEGLYGEGGVNDDFLSSKKNNPPSVKSV